MLLRTSLLLASVTVVAGCPKGTKPADPEKVDAPSGPPYAAMFEADRTWTFDVETTDSEWQDEAEGMVDTKDTMRASCTVSRVAEYPGGKLAEITCDDDWPDNAGRDPLSGAWAANDRGLYRLYDWPTGEGAPELDEQWFVIAAVPVEETRPTFDPEYGEDPVSELAITKDGDAWCWKETVTMDDAVWWSVCMGAQGPIKGEFGQAGGVTHQATFTVAP